MTTIGRVEFIVGLDGNRLPSQARRLARQMEAAGRRAGDGFTDAFEGRFDDRLSQIGARVANRLGGSGRLAGSTFADDFDGVVQGRFRRIQENLAEILADKDAFADYARGFDTVGEATDRLNADLERLRKETISYRDENGKLRQQAVLTWNEFQAFGAEIRRLSADTEQLFARERELADATNDLEANYARLTRTVGDSDAFRQMAERVGGTEIAYRRLRQEIIETGNILGRSRIEVEEFVDRLERTRESVDRVGTSLVALEDHGSRADRMFLALGRTVAKPWNMLERDVRLVIGLIASAADQVAVLGSTLGAGLIGLGAAASQGVVGVGGLAAVFVTLSKEVDELPPHLRRVATEFQGFKRALTDAREVIASSAFARMGGVFDDLGDSVRALSPEFDALGRSVGNVFRDFARSVQPGADAFNEIRELIDNSAEGFERLAGMSGTLSLALVRGFNQAQPLVEDLYGWMERLIGQFDAFTQSNSFDQWIASAQNVWGSFGDLLDEVGRALNDLASPAAVQRTTDLLDNLAGFMPALAGLLDILGRLDPLGLLAQLLNDVGSAITPLIEPTAELAEQLSRLLSAGIEGFARGLGALATALVPVVDGLTNFLNVIPDDALEVLAATLTTAAAAFLIFRGAQGVMGAVAALDTFVTKAAVAAGASTNLAGKISSGLGKAGLVGAAIVGVLALSEGLDNLYNDMTRVDDKARNAVAGTGSLSSAYEQLGGSVFGVLPALTDVDFALDNLTGSGVEGMLGSLGNAFRLGGDQANALSQTLGRLSPELANLALTDLPAAASAFSGWATELGASDAQILNMLNTMPEFKQVLIDTALATGVAATDQNLLALAMGESEGASQDASSALVQVKDAAALTGDEVDSLSSKLRNFGDTEITTMEATSAFESAIDDLTESVTTNGATLDLNTEQGRANQASLLDSVQAAKDHAAATLDETGSIEQANAVLSTQKQRLIDTIRQLDAAGYEAGNYTEFLNLIPDDVTTFAQVTGVAAAEAALNNLARTRQATIWVVTKGAAWTPGVDRPMASGALVTGPTRALIGEAGTEAVVPLERPLSQVDPAVRWLSAIAQGKLPHMADGGIVTSGQQISIEKVEITVVTDEPETAGDSVLKALAENVNG